MKAAEANPAAYVTRREVPRAWRTRATTPTGHTRAASTTVATLVPAARRRPRVAGSSRSMRGSRWGRRWGRDREVARLEERLDAAEVVTASGESTSSSGRPIAGRIGQEREDDADGDRDDRVGARRPRKRRAAPTSGTSAPTARATRRMTTMATPTPTAVTTSSGTGPPDADPLGDRRGDRDQPGRDGGGHRQRLEPARAEGPHDEPARTESTRERTTNAEIVSTQCAMRAILAGRLDFSTTRVRTYDGGRSRVLVMRDRNSRVFCRSAGPGHTTAVPISGWGGVRQRQE